jgi:hypothetical protein
VSHVRVMRAIKRLRCAKHPTRSERSDPFWIAAAELLAIRHAHEPMAPSNVGSTTGLAMQIDDALHPGPPERGPPTAKHGSSTVLLRLG